MDNAYWSMADCGWRPCPGAPDALVTPWSAHGLSVPVLPSARSAAEVLRLPTRQAVLAAALPQPREQAQEPVSH